MEANELRIGNLVYTKFSDKAVKVKSVNWIPQFEYYIVFADDAINNIKHINPIQITEEWMKRLGFIVFKDALFGMTEYRKGSFTLDGKFLENGYGQVNTYPIEYIHQLQNLYFALTGNELIVGE
ncbi:MAG TPA: hypothetical protein DCY35_03795 [Prolixibacteraceae bacterium]|nr:hypothetical protein [Prolixibacteraceae bacterium]